MALKGNVEGLSDDMKALKGDEVAARACLHDNIICRCRIT